MQACPEQLKAIGVSETTWNQFATMLHEKINMNFEPPCPGGIVMLICGVVSLGLCLPRMCKQQSRRVAVFDKNLLEQAMAQAIDRARSPECAHGQASGQSGERTSDRAKDRLS